MSLTNLLIALISKSADTNTRSFKVNHPDNNLDWSWKNQALIDEFRNLVKKPIHNEYLRIFIDQKIYAFTEVSKASLDKKTCIPMIFF